MVNDCDNSGRAFQGICASCHVNGAMKMLCSFRDGDTLVANVHRREHETLLLHTNVNILYRSTAMNKAAWARDGRL